MFSNSIQHLCSPFFESPAWTGLIVLDFRNCKLFLTGHFLWLISCEVEHWLFGEFRWVVECSFEPRIFHTAPRHHMAFLRHHKTFIILTWPTSESLHALSGVREAFCIVKGRSWATPWSSWSPTWWRGILFHVLRFVVKHVFSLA